jgi:hypothetical protein
MPDLIPPRRAAADDPSSTPGGKGEEATEVGIRADKMTTQTPAS